MSDSKADSTTAPAARTTRPLDRFWPYADLPEAPTPAELAALDPDLHAALFGPRDLPFSITVVFAPWDGEGFDEAQAMARASAECRETGNGADRRLRARFFSHDALRLRDLYERVGHRPGTDVLIDDRPVPFARELWLPLVWFQLLP